MESGVGEGEERRNGVLFTVFNGCVERGGNLVMGSGSWLIKAGRRHHRAAGWI